jgi:hypothetical protein
VPSPRGKRGERQFSVFSFQFSVNPWFNSLMSFRGNWMARAGHSRRVKTEN